MTQDADDREFQDFIHRVNGLVDEMSESAEDRELLEAIFDRPFTRWM